MGTNFYRIPTHEDMLRRQKILLKQIKMMDMSAENIERGMRDISLIEYSQNYSPWDLFIDETNIHLGKRSAGWKFCWNFNDDEFYSDKKSLLEFIRSGRVIDEYGTELDIEAFITMALEWGEPDGMIVDKAYNREQRSDGVIYFYPKYYDKIIDGLRVSPLTDFC